MMNATRLGEIEAIPVFFNVWLHTGRKRREAVSVQLPVPIRDVLLHEICILIISGISERIIISRARRDEHGDEMRHQIIPAGI